MAIDFTEINFAGSSVIQHFYQIDQLLVVGVRSAKVAQFDLQSKKNDRTLKDPNSTLSEI